MSDAIWYVKPAEKEHGPFTPKQLRKLASSLQIDKQTPVRRETDTDYVRAGKVQGLFVTQQRSESVKVPPVEVDPGHSVSRQVDRICFRFEAAWNSGSAPRIEDFLQEVPGDTDNTLLLELLKLDVRFRSRQDEGSVPKLVRS